jgi:pro-apoptotic serine protease NMA111
VTTDPVPMIVISRAAVPVSICDLRITIGNRSIPGRVLYIGVVVVLTFDANLLSPETPLPSLSTKQYKVGDEIELFALDDEHQLIQKRTEISAINGIITRQCNPPRWRISNTEGISLLEHPYSNGGILIDPGDKSVVALWMTIKSQNSSGKNTAWKIGLNYDFYIRPIIEDLQAGKELEHRCFGWEFDHLQLASAINLGLSEHHATRIANIAKSVGTVARPIFVSGKLCPPSQVEHDLKIGDVVIEINGKPVGRMADVRNLSQLDSAEFLILRNGEEKEITIQSRPLPSQSTSRIVCWAGAVVHQTHSSVLEQTTPEFVSVSKREDILDPESAVYICSIMYGSPAIGNLRPIQWILEVDGQKVRTLDDMINIISNLKERDEGEEYTRVRMMGRKGITCVVSVRLDSKFWPAWMLERKGEQWVRTELE